jgi:hypothetical protein
MRPAHPSSIPTTVAPSAEARVITPRIAALRPGQSPPAVRRPSLADVGDRLIIKGKPTAITERLERSCWLPDQDPGREVAL